MDRITIMAGSIYLESLENKPTLVKLMDMKFDARCNSHPASSSARIGAA